MSVMRFDNENLFVSMVSKYGMNLYLGAGFSAYAYNEEGDALPLGREINDRLIDMFALDKSRNYTLSKTCQKIKRNNADALENVLKDTYRVSSFDAVYLYMNWLPIRNIITLNIDNLIEKVYDHNDSTKIISDNNINGPLEKQNVINLYKLHGCHNYV